MTVQIILASASPRRMELLDQIKVAYKASPVDIDETPLPSEAPLDYVQRLAAEKSAACVARLGDSLPVLAADTAVVLDNLIMGKPKDRDDALAMLRLLSGRMHRVYSAVSLRGREHGQAVSITEVTFRFLTECEIEAYWHSGEPADKAGSYAIQGLGGVFVESISGSFSGVVGLPLFETAELLSRQGIGLFK
ncbi:Maf family protein [Candidatus Methylobacter oryzae]|uniref:dTTP/UTP pyrophosphatase n=1 Tax=Candidatus Methylobacter oryzae TaxID=2497749 RepID=A0ABY3C6T1_9GAMM|nr:Maf family protein [Candidatus Methylobacter oryzae]TRW91309.1 septum formation inhibitor Maf [Candidatus Methylobacter oryzae]